MALGQEEVTWTLGIALEAGPPVGGGSGSHQVQQNPLPVVWGGWNPTLCACKYIIHGYPTYTFLPCLLLCLHNLQGRKIPHNSLDSTWNSHQKSGKQMDVGKAAQALGLTRCRFTGRHLPLLQPLQEAKATRNQINIELGSLSL